MGSLENGVALKRAPLLRPLPPAAAAGRLFFRRPRSRLARFLLFEKVDYLHWIGTAAFFFVVVLFFQAFLPGSVVERDGEPFPGDRGSAMRGGIRGLEFGEGIAFVPSRFLERLEEERRRENASLMQLPRPVRRVGLRKPRLAMVFGDLYPDETQLHMVSVAAALKEAGYEIQVFSFEDGPVEEIWRTMGVPIHILDSNRKIDKSIDWLDYNGILVNSLDARLVFSSLLQEPFKFIPVMWTIYERSLALHISQYIGNGPVQLVDDWKQAFSRATVVVFPNYILPMMYYAFDAGNFFVIPGSPAEAFGTVKHFLMHNSHDLRVDHGFLPEDFVIAIVGSQFSYTGKLLEHALILQALVPLLQQFSTDDTSYSHLKVRILSDNSTFMHNTAIEKIALNVGFPRGIVEHITVNEEISTYLGIVDFVIYGSFLEEPSFPSMLMQAMSFGKPVVAPDLRIIRKYVDDRVNGYLFPKENIGALTQILVEAVSDGKISLSAKKIASIGKAHSRNSMATENIEGYVILLENIIKFPSEVVTPISVKEISLPSKEWQWDLFDNVMDTYYLNKSFKGFKLARRIGEEWLNSAVEDSHNTSSKVDEAFSSIAWEEERKVEMENIQRRLEEDELKDRSDQPHGTWEEVYRNVKRADRTRNELHERDDRELERTGQPLCIYEPYFGEGAWPFLHQTSLYRGIGLSSKGRRPGADDIDASSRLPLLNNLYYRDILGEYGAFFALANRIDRIHKNGWIGFQSWRASAMGQLSRYAESMILEAIQAQRHGDALYFWVRMDQDPRNPARQDFWSFCDAINAGNCRFAFTAAFRRMYGVDHGWNSLPQMPDDGDTWSVMQSWALPTRSFLEFVMFSRMFVDSLDAEMYDQHHQTGTCYLSLYKDSHCYSQVLELLVNVWAYHSARKMVYVNPETGAMQEQHRLKSRRHHMWIRWFSYATLKSMDEDLAEEYDSDRHDRRWLWPATGEIFWQGAYERERNARQQQKERRKQESKDKIQRIKKRARQKTLGKYVKPLPEDTTGRLNDTRSR